MASSSRPDPYTDGFSIQYDVEAGRIRGLQGPHPPAKQKLLTVSWRISPSRSLKNNGSDTQPGDEHRSGNCYRGKASNLTQVLSFQAVGQGSEQRHVVSR
jgi:hypothetical protein